MSGGLLPKKRLCILLSPPLSVRTLFLMQSKHAECVSCKINVCYDCSDPNRRNGAYVSDTILFEHDSSAKLIGVKYYTYRVLCNKCLIDFYAILNSNKPFNKYFKAPINANDKNIIAQTYPAINATYEINNHRWKTGNKCLIPNPEFYEMIAGKDYSLQIPIAAPPMLENVFRHLFFDLFFVFFFNPCLLVYLT